MMYYVRFLLVLMLMPALAACSWVKDDLGDCPQGCRLRLLRQEVAAQVGSDFDGEIDEAFVSVFDAGGKYLDTYTISGSELSASGWSALLPLGAGTYRFVVWTGAEDDCYELTPEAMRGGLTAGELTLRLARSASGRQDAYLHPLWYGSTGDVTVDAMGVTEATVGMIRDTNTIVAVIQDMTGRAMDADAYAFEIVAGNGLMDFGNNVLPDEDVTYGAYHTQTADLSAEDAGMAQAVSVARAEINTLRLMANDEARLIVTEKATGRRILNVNLTRYLLLTREMYEGRVGYRLTNQQYLDLESHYSVVFYMTPTGEAAEPYTCTSLRINGWIVRINDDVHL